MSELEAIRLDKWLWTARFFKTRKLAAEAISGGKVMSTTSVPNPKRRQNRRDALHQQRQLSVGDYDYRH